MANKVQFILVNTYKTKAELATMAQTTYPGAIIFYKAVNPTTTKEESSIWAHGKEYKTGGASEAVITIDSVDPGSHTFAISPVHGDFYVKEEIINGSTIPSRTAYIYDANTDPADPKWKALDGNYTAENIYFPNGIKRTEEWGCKEQSTEVKTECVGKNLKEVLDFYLLKETWRPVRILCLNESLGAYSVDTPQASFTVKTGTVDSTSKNITYTAITGTSADVLIGTPLKLESISFDPKLSLTTATTGPYIQDVTGEPTRVLEIQLGALYTSGLETDGYSTTVGGEIIKSEYYGSPKLLRSYYNGEQTTASCKVNVTANTVLNFLQTNGTGTTRTYTAGEQISKNDSVTSKTNAGDTAGSYITDPIIAADKELFSNLGLNKFTLDGINGNSWGREFRLKVGNKWEKLDSVAGLIPGFDALYQVGTNGSRNEDHKVSATAADPTDSNTSVRASNSSSKTITITGYYPLYGNMYEQNSLNVTSPATSVHVLNSKKLTSNSIALEWAPRSGWTNLTGNYQLQYPSNYTVSTITWDGGPITKNAGYKITTRTNLETLGGTTTQQYSILTIDECAWVGDNTKKFKIILSK